jgi:hypothetical protein
MINPGLIILLDGGDMLCVTLCLHMKSWAKKVLQQAQYQQQQKLSKENWLE